MPCRQEVEEPGGAEDLPEAEGVVDRPDAALRLPGPGIRVRDLSEDHRRPARIGAAGSGIRRGIRKESPHERRAARDVPGELQGVEPVDRPGETASSREPGRSRCNVTRSPETTFGRRRRRTRADPSPGTRRGRLRSRTAGSRRASSRSTSNLRRPRRPGPRAGSSRRSRRRRRRATRCLQTWSRR